MRLGRPAKQQIPLLQGLRVPDQCAILWGFAYVDGKPYNDYVARDWMAASKYIETSGDPAPRRSGSFKVKLGDRLRSTVYDFVSGQSVIAEY